MSEDKFTHFIAQKLATKPQQETKQKHPNEHPQYTDCKQSAEYVQKIVIHNRNCAAFLY